MRLTAKQFLFLFFIALLWISILVFRTPFSFKSSLMDIIPNDKVPSELMEKYTSDINIVIEADNFNLAQNAAEQITENLKKQNIHLKYQSEKLMEDFISLMLTYRHSFLSDNDYKLLKSGKTNQVLKQSISKVTSSWMPSFFKIKEDPFSLLNNYIQTITPPTFNWQIKNGFLWQNQKGKDYILLQIPVPTNIKDLLPRVATIQKAIPQINGAKIYLSGAPLHTARMYQKSKVEINVISILSVLILVILTYSLFRKFTTLFKISINLIIAFCAGLGTVLLFFKDIHFLAIAFSASLIGICIDYSFHHFSSSSKSSQKNLFYSFLTSFFSFTPLLFSSLPLLKQIAVFIMAGLCATYLWIRFLNPVQQTEPKRFFHFTLPKKYFFFCLILLCCFGLPFLKTENSPQVFYQASAELQQSETLFHKLSKQNTSNFLIIKASDLQTALETEERIKEKTPFFSLSTLLPSVKKQKENQKLIHNLYQNESQNLQKALNIMPVFEQTPFLIKEKLPSSQQYLFDSFIIETSENIFTLAPTQKKINNLPKNATIFSVQNYLEQQLNTSTNESYLLLLSSFLMLCIMLFIIYKQRMFLYITPPLLGIAGTLSLLNLCGQPLTFFHILSSFIIVGLGIDYAIFYLDKNTKDVTPVFYSFLSSFFGFGLLCCISFKPIVYMGSTISIGLAITYLTSVFMVSSAQNGKKDWYKQKEQSAGKIRLEFLWYFYRLVGLCGLKSILRIITLFIYLFAGNPKKASRQYQQILKNYYLKHNIKPISFSTYGHLLSYADSLAEKMSVICDKKIRFKISINQDENWKTFKQNIINNKGMFLMCSHLGNIEALAGFSYQFPQLPQRKLNALMQMNQSSVFRQFIEEHQTSKAFELFSTEDLNFDGIMNLYERLLSGELVMMAADRISAQSPNKNISAKLLDKSCKLPIGAFKFAQKLAAPTYAIAFLRVKRNEYRLFLKQLNISAPIQQTVDEYTCFIEHLLLQYPKQWYNFYFFFEN